MKGKDRGQTKDLCTYITSNGTNKIIIKSNRSERVVGEGRGKPGRGGESEGLERERGNEWEILTV